MQKGKEFYIPMLQVPSITLGNVEVGPVWFSRRPDQAWSSEKYGMIRTMDKVVKGALGGSALRYTKVTIDYPKRLIQYE